MNPPDHPTPRTDAAIVLLCDLHGVEIDFARTLERELTETERLRFGADADRRRLRAEVERWELAFQEQYARAEKAEADNAKWQKLLLMSRDDREIDLISEIEEQARLLGKSGEREADLLGKIERLNRVIERASVQFFHEGSDGETAAKMLTVLNEAK